ncbi:DUF6476 family protein [Cypionkella sp.]|uniref:DUF6476 family protein n=1 Tax=Cypionkella sp. TaxID=2811411 RepID=UPI0027646885|nr:DUF6476 family protein [Cypionkella sp.]
MTDTPEEPRLPPSLRLLKALVIVLMITMICGVITVVGLLVTRMPNANAALPILPSSLSLPAGKTALAVTMGQGWVGVVTQDSHFLVFNSAGTLVQDVTLTLP